MTTLEFEWDSRDLKIWRGRTTEKALVRAMRLAGNRALRELNAGSLEHVTSRKNLPTERVRAGLVLVQPKRGDSLEDLEWQEKASGAKMPLSRFPHVTTPRSGVFVRVNRAGGMQQLGRAFRVRLDSGHAGIFQRRGRERFPIDELLSSRVSDTMSDSGVADRLLETAKGTIGSAFERGLARELEKAKKKGS